ncbi:zinc-binding alcohol dehydrogenase family protein [Dactylosporangium sp. NPDC048998]|uniref:quinone oxidoreductase family protein n=1 Tax=Dactylosporangium sp. NPDC048998 TaxID=3363976 RepID=UPI0037133DB8
MHSHHISLAFLNPVRYGPQYQMELDTNSEAGMRAVQIREFGGPEVVQVRDLPEPVPAAAELLVEVARCGVNFADSLLRENGYIASATLPIIPGGEVVGRTPDGRRVAAMIQNGGYAEKAVVPEAHAFPVPDELDDVEAVALLAQGLTAWWLVNRTARIQPGESVVVHAAAGGVGSLALQLARLRGAERVIAVASTPEKRDVALSLGADNTIDPAADDLTAELCAANDGAQVDVVLEMTGGRVTDQSLAALAPFGRLALYGMASRIEPEKVSLRALQRRSATISGFWLMHAFTRPEILEKAYAELAALVTAGDLRVIHGGDYPMSEVRRAHEDLRNRQSIGKLVIDPAR